MFINHLIPKTIEPKNQVRVIVSRLDEILNERGKRFYVENFTISDTKDAELINLQKTNDAPVFARIFITV